jgi:tetratricopeptide (TPR) repeat protein
MSFPRFLSLKKIGIFSVLFALSFANIKAAVGELPATGGVQPETGTGSNDALRAYLQLQEQLHDTQLTIERNRLEAQALAVQDAITLSNRLQSIEQSLAVQFAGDSAETQRTNHLLMSVIGVFGLVGFAAAMLTVYFQSRAVSRLADISAALSASRGMGFSGAGAIGFGEREVLANGTVEHSNARLIGLVQHLEKRITELEQTTALPLKETTPAGHSEPPVHPELGLKSVADDKSAHIAQLLEQGQSFLSHDRPEDAIASFDEVLAREPNHAEALVKKGTALEKLRQPQEALEYYDRAIAADNSLTIAYLHKGGLCSRLEKYGEAMECYERALHTQEKKRAA